MKDIPFILFDGDDSCDYILKDLKFGDYCDYLGEKLFHCTRVKDTPPNIIVYVRKSVEECINICNFNFPLFLNVVTEKSDCRYSQIEYFPFKYTDDSIQELFNIILLRLQAIQAKSSLDYIFPYFLDNPMIESTLKRIQFLPNNDYQRLCYIQKVLKTYLVDSNLADKVANMFFTYIHFSQNLQPNVYVPPLIFQDVSKESEKPFLLLHTRTVQYPEGKVLIRKCYEVLFTEFLNGVNEVTELNDTIKKLFKLQNVKKKPSPGCIILGHPGIGKTSLIYYMIYRIKELQIRLRFPSVSIVKGKKGTTDCEIINLIGGELKVGKSCSDIVIVDTFNKTDDLNVVKFCFVVSSPDEQNYNHYVGATKFYIKPFSSLDDDDEMLMWVENCLPEVLSTEFRLNRKDYNKYGNIPRHVYYALLMKTQGFDYWESIYFPTILNLMKSEGILNFTRKYICRVIDEGDTKREKVEFDTSFSHYILTYWFENADTPSQHWSNFVSSDIRDYVSGLITIADTKEENDNLRKLLNGKSKDSLTFSYIWKRILLFDVIHTLEPKSMKFFNPNSIYGFFHYFDHLFKVNKNSVEYVEFVSSCDNDDVTIMGDTFIVSVINSTKLDFQYGLFTNLKKFWSKSTRQLRYTYYVILQNGCSITKDGADTITNVILNQFSGIFFSQFKIKFYNYSFEQKAPFTKLIDKYDYNSRRKTPLFSQKNISNPQSNKAKPLPNTNNTLPDERQEVEIRVPDDTYSTTIIPITLSDVNFLSLNSSPKDLRQVSGTQIAPSITKNKYLGDDWNSVMKGISASNFQLITNRYDKNNVCHLSIFKACQTIEEHDPTSPLKINNFYERQCFIDILNKITNVMETSKVNGLRMNFLIYGDEKIGKSTLCTYLAITLATGKGFSVCLTRDKSKTYYSPKSTNIFMEIEYFSEVVNQDIDFVICDNQLIGEDDYSKVGCVVLVCDKCDVARYKTFRSKRCPIELYIPILRDDEMIKYAKVDMMKSALSKFDSEDDNNIKSENSFDFDSADDNSVISLFLSLYKKWFGNYPSPFFDIIQGLQFNFPNINESLVNEISEIPQSFLWNYKKEVFMYDAVSIDSIKPYLTFKCPLLERLFMSKTTDFSFGANYRYYLSQPTNPCYVFEGIIIFMLSKSFDSSKWLRGLKLTPKDKRNKVFSLSSFMKEKSDEKLLESPLYKNCLVNLGCYPTFPDIDCILKSDWIYLLVQITVNKTHSLNPRIYFLYKYLFDELVEKATEVPPPDMCEKIGFIEITNRLAIINKFEDKNGPSPFQDKLKFFIKINNKLRPSTDQLDTNLFEKKPLAKPDKILSCFDDYTHYYIELIRKFKFLPKKVETLLESAYYCDNKDDLKTFSPNLLFVVVNDHDNDVAISFTQPQSKKDTKEENKEPENNSEKIQFYLRDVTIEKPVVDHFLAQFPNAADTNLVNLCSFYQEFIYLYRIHVNIPTINIFSEEDMCTPIPIKIKDNVKEEKVYAQLSDITVPKYRSLPEGLRDKFILFAPKTVSCYMDVINELQKKDHKKPGEENCSEYIERMGTEIMACCKKYSTNLWLYHVDQSGVFVLFCFRNGIYSEMIVLWTQNNCTYFIRIITTMQ